jgi:hypothetical protein
MMGLLQEKEEILYWIQFLSLSALVVHIIKLIMLALSLS